jgi:transcriptional regulator with XRE-family HTH domain
MAREPEPIAARRRALGERLTVVRLAADLTQGQLGKAAICDRTTVAHIESGRGRGNERFWRAADDACRARGALLAAFHEFQAAKAEHERQTRAAELTELRAKASTLRAADTVADVRRSQQEWLHVRNAPGVRGRELTELAAWLHPESDRAPGGHVLAGPGWLLGRPVPLDTVELVYSDDQPATHPLGSLGHVLPLTDRGELYAGYSRAVRDLVRPRLLENRLSYRLLDVRTDHALAMTFGTTTFFEVFDVKQALAHEFKAAWLASNRSVPEWDALPLRSALGDPFDPRRLLMSPGISTLTIRADRSGDGRHRFVLHERDGGKVADGGGLCHVMPAGEFQPSSVDPADVRNDFSLWHNIMREFSEEFLGNPEHDGCASRPIDYAHDEPFRSFERARATGGLRLWHYGLVMEPLELGATQMTVAVVTDEVFDELFADLVRTNDEGRIVGHVGRADLPFTAEAVDRLDPRLSGSALTLLRLAWRDRHILLRD